MIGLLLWALIVLAGPLVGTMLLLTLPWMTARVIGPDAQDRVAQWYLWAAQTLTGRGGVIVRDEELQLVKKTWDDEYGGDRDEAGGRSRHHYDYFGALDRLKGRIFGLGLSRFDSWVSPLLADIGERKWRAIEEDDVGPDYHEDDGWIFVDGIPVDKTSRLVDLSAAEHLIQGSAKPEVGDAAEERARKSQTPFSTVATPMQALLLIGAFCVPFIASLYFLGGGEEAAQGAGNETVLSIMLGTVVAANRLDDLAEWLNDAPERIGEWWDEDDEDDGRKGPPDDPTDLRPYLLAALVAVVGFLFAPVIVGLFYGLLAGVVVAGLQLVTIAAVPFGVWFFGGGLPAFLAMPLAKLSWVLAMVSVDNRGVLVERDSGTLEFRKLRDGFEERFEAVLEDGTRLPIAGDVGDLYRFAWGELGVTAEKTQRNMGHLTADLEDRAQADGGFIRPPRRRGGYQPCEKSRRNMGHLTVDVTPEMATDGGYIQPTNRRGGYLPLIRPADEHQYTVTLPHLETWCQGSSKAQAIRTGREKALTEEGGGEGLSQTLFLLLLVGAPVLGALMGYLMT